LLYHRPWEANPCEAEPGSQAMAPGLPVVGTRQRSEVDNLPVATKLRDSFSFASRAGAVSLSVSHWLEPTNTSSPADKAQGDPVQSRCDVGFAPSLLKRTSLVTSTEAAKPVSLHLGRKP